MMYIQADRLTIQLVYNTGLMEIIINFMRLLKYNFCCDFFPLLFLFLKFISPYGSTRLFLFQKAEFTKGNFFILTSNF